MLFSQLIISSLHYTKELRVFILRIVVPIFNDVCLLKVSIARGNVFCLQTHCGVVIFFIFVAGVAGVVDVQGHLDHDHEAGGHCRHQRPYRQRPEPHTRGCLMFTLLM